jgi:hypothetical protein
MDEDEQLPPELQAVQDVSDDKTRNLLTILRDELGFELTEEFVRGVVTCQAVQLALSGSPYVVVALTLVAAQKDISAPEAVRKLVDYCVRRALRIREVMLKEI